MKPMVLVSGAVSETMFAIPKASPIMDAKNSAAFEMGEGLPVSVRYQAECAVNLFLGN